MLQPKGAPIKGVNARRRQWNAVSGGRAGQTNVGIIGVGLAAGVIAGLVIGLQADPLDVTAVIDWLDVPLAMDTLSLALPLALAMGPVGAYAGHMLSASGTFQQGMMQVIVNERRSVIRPQMVTGQVEAWIPKALLSWRSHEWRYRAGKPYLWLQLELGKRIEHELKGTLDYLLLRNDLFEAQDSAIYAQRSMNRMISASAEDYAEVEQEEEDGYSRIAKLAPFLLAAGLLLSGVIVFILMSG